MSSFIDIVIVAGAVATILWPGALLTVYLRSVYRRTFGSRGLLSRTLDQLDTGITREFVVSLLGVPKFRLEHATGTIDTYFTKHAVVKFNLDSNDRVNAFSVCVTDPKFSFRTDNLTAGNIQAVLGRTRLWEIDVRFRQGINAIVGASAFHYGEAYYYGRPGLYRYYYAAQSFQGVAPWPITFTYREGLFPPAPFHGERPHDKILKARARSVINTISISESNSADFIESVQIERESLALSRELNAKFRRRKV